ncbi:Nicalin [Blattella germanica]|nr:Nicalin [Blattella germanica]
MWFEADEIVELFRGYIPYYLLIALPIFIIISPVNPVGAAHEFPVHRMQQFDLHGISHGCRSSPVNLEARSISGWGTSRHCVVARLEDISTEQFREVRARAGALLQMMELEETMMQQEISIPVYFAEWSPELQRILDDISNSFVTDDRADSAAEGKIMMFDSCTQFSHPGKLSGYGIEEKLPTIAIVAHYDSFGVAPELSFGADSNGSGVAMLMELARLFSHLYTNSKSHARYNIIFLLSGAGKLNYQGSKKWLEDQLDGLEGSLVQGLKEIAERQHSNMTVDGVHKKINLAEEVLAWEHERYSIRRLPAFTLSSLKGVEEESIRSWLDFLSSQPRSAQLLAEKNSPLVSVLRDAMNRHVLTFPIQYFKIAYLPFIVKPAIFDLFLTIAIATYLGLIYLIIQNFPALYVTVSKVVSLKSMKSQ